MGGYGTSGIDRARRALDRATAAVGSASERLASGSRTNRPSDDPAGLAVSTTISAAARVLARRARSAEDVRSYVETARGATEALKGITARQQELAAGAANGSYTLAQRKALDAEASALTEEFGRIVASTRWNGRRVFSAEEGRVTLAAAGSDPVGAIEINPYGGGISREWNGTVPSWTGVASLGPSDVLTLGDTNGDGRPDVVTLTKTGVLSVSLGNGDGTFSLGRSSAAGGAAGSSVTVADFDRDGRADVAATDSATNTVRILLGNGDGTFRSVRQYATGTGPRSLVAADVSGDGIADLVTADSGSGVGILLGNGDGTFRARTGIGIGVNPGSVALGDLDGDGDQDVYVATRYAGTGVILTGNGDGSFRAPTVLAGAGATNGYESGRLADVDHDGKLDVVSTASSPGTQRVFLGNGDGTFKAALSSVVGGTPFRQVVADVTGDGLADVVSFDAFDYHLHYLVGNGDGTFKASVSGLYGALGYSPAAADLNGDGVADVVVSDTNFGFSRALVTPTRSSFSLPAVSLLSAGDARRALDDLGRWATNLSAVDASLGAAAARMAVVARESLGRAERLTEAAARITDADVAGDAAALLAGKVRQEAAAALLAQADRSAPSVLRLLGR